MTQERILIFGRGYLSTVLSSYYTTQGQYVAVYGSDHLSLTNLAALKEVIRTERPTRVINTVAYTATAAAEQPENRPLAFDLNVHVPCTILEALSETQIPWLHFSTGMMFDGTRPDGTGWQEADSAKPSGYYCWTKNWADGALAPFLESNKVIIARIHLPISSQSHPRNFLDRLLGFDNVIAEKSSLTIVDDMLPVIDQLFEKQAYGMYNSVNPGTISAADITTAAQQAGLIPAEKKIGHLTRADLPATQTFPVLSTEKLAALGISLPEVHESLERVLELRK